MARFADSFSLLTRNRDFAALWSSETISTLGDRVHRVALAALVYELTGSLTQTGIAFVATALPDLVLGLLAGVMVDRWDRRMVLFVSDVLRVPLVILIPFAAYWSLWAAYLLLFALNTVSIVARPAKTALIPSVVDAEDLNKANSLSSVSENVSDIIGYPFAGALLGLLGAWLGSTTGLAAAFIFDSVTYAVSALLVLTIRVSQVERIEENVSSVWADLREGIAYVRSSPVIRANTLVMLLGPLTIGATTPLLVGYAWNDLGGGEWEYALLGAGISLGSIIGGLWISSEPAIRPGFLIIGGLALMGSSVMATASVAQLWPAVIAIGISGVGSMMVLIPSVTLVQQLTPGRLLGRVFSLRATLIFGAIIFSNAVGGWTGEIFGVRPSLLTCGALLIISALVAGAFRSVRCVDLPERPLSVASASD